jgi:hypothetical protein
MSAEIPRFRLFPLPLDVTSLLPGLSTTSFTASDFSSFVPTGTEGVLVRRRASPATSATSGFILARATGETAEPGTDAKSRATNGNHNTNYRFHHAFFQKISVDREMDLRRVATSSFSEETFALLGYALGGSGARMEPQFVSEDATSLLPGDSVTTPTASDFTSLLPDLTNVFPDGFTAGALWFQFQGEVAAGTRKHLHARRTGESDTSNTLTQVAACGPGASSEKTGSFIIPLGSGDQIDLWWDTTQATVSTNLRLIAVFSDKAVLP